MSNKVTVIDYGTGNLSSLNKSLSKINCIPVITRDPEIIAKSDKIILLWSGGIWTCSKNFK